MQPFITYKLWNIFNIIYVIRTVEIIEHTYPQDIIREKQLGNLKKKAQEDMSDTDKTLMIIDTCFVDLCGTGTELFFFLGVNMVK